MYLVTFYLLNISPTPHLFPLKEFPLLPVIHFTQLSKVLRCKELFYNFVLFHLFYFFLTFLPLYFILFSFTLCAEPKTLESILKPIANVESVVFWCSQESDALPTELHRGKRKL